MHGQTDMMYNHDHLFYRKGGTSASSSSQCKAPDSTLIGRQIEMRFKKIKWFTGEINSYDEYSGKYGVYFPCDGETIFIYPDDKDIRYVD